MRVVIVSVLALTIPIASMGVGIAKGQGGGGYTKSDEWFPCKGHGCGCTSAEMCDTSCCCVKPARPKPKPASESCCSEPAVEQGCDITVQSDSGHRLFMQSSVCHGRKITLVLASPTWNFDRMEVGFDAYREVHQAPVRNLVLMSQVTLEPDPPPPRPG